MHCTLHSDRHVGHCIAMAIGAAGGGIDEGQFGAFVGIAG